MDHLRLRSQGGFTLIELLVVIAIIGILAAIAIPQFAAYRRRGFDAQVQSDLKNAATAQEANFVTTNAYINGPLASGTPPGFNLSPNVTVTSAATPNSYVLTGSVVAGCAAGTGVWTLDSTTGQVTPTAICN